MDAEHAVDLLVVQRMDVLVDGVTGQLHLIRSSIRKAINPYRYLKSSWIAERSYVISDWLINGWQRMVNDISIRTNNY